ncbi:hypothetical protein ACTWP5_20835 [Streptomyces sp. 4N509B]|uniref:hypothetical protein n=1 Tax=Streptomyces sp. 4N509B TaxID=3457413 RepID=UPI003FD058F3
MASLGLAALLLPATPAAASAGPSRAPEAPRPTVADLGDAATGAYLTRFSPGGDGEHELVPVDPADVAAAWPVDHLRPTPDAVGAAGSPARPVTGQSELYEITERGIGDAGQPLTPGEEWTSYAVDLDTLAAYSPEEAVPAGDYAVVSVVDGHVLQVHTLLGLAEDTAVTFDTRQATPVDLTVFDADATATTRTATVSFSSDDLGVGIGLRYVTRTTDAGEAAVFRTQYSGATDPEGRLTAGLGASWADEEGTAAYHAGYEGDAPDLLDGFSRQVTREELAAIELRQGGPAGGPDEGLLRVDGAAHGFVGEVTLPRTTTHHVQGGDWAVLLNVPDPVSGATLVYGSEFEPYEAGRTYARTLNVGPFAPTADSGWLYRQGDELIVRTQLLADGDGHFVGAVPYAGETTLRRDGELLATSDAPLYRDQFTLPAESEPATYELTTSFRRDAPFSSEVTLSFTFDSATVPGDGTQELLSMVEFSPALRLDSTAPAGRRMTIPVTVHGAAAGENLDALTVEASYDGGESWRRVPVTDDGTARVVNPPAGGSVSLRGTATDHDGNVTTLTVIDAYRTR